MNGRAGHDVVSRRFKGFAWIQSDDVQALTIEKMILIVAQEMDGAFDNHADFRSWSDDSERVGFRFGTVRHRMVEKDLRQSHVVVVVAVGDEEIVQIAGRDAMVKHVHRGAETCVDQDVVIEQRACAVLIRFVFRQGAASAEHSDGSHVKLLWAIVRTTNGRQWTRKKCLADVAHDADDFAQA